MPLSEPRRASLVKDSRSTWLPPDTYPTVSVRFDVSVITHAFQSHEPSHAYTLGIGNRAWQTQQPTEQQVRAGQWAPPLITASCSIAALSLSMSGSGGRSRGWLLQTPWTFSITRVAHTEPGMDTDWDSWPTVYGDILSVGRGHQSSTEGTSSTLHAPYSTAWNQTRRCQSQDGDTGTTALLFEAVATHRGTHSLSATA